MDGLSVRVPHFTLSNRPATLRHTRMAVALVVVCALVTAALLPIASRPGPLLPGFTLLHNSALIAAYGMGAWVLYTQYRRAPSLNLLLAATGTLFTAAIIVLQLLSLPGVLSPPGKRLLGASSETTAWLWAFWHCGPPAWGLAYALAQGDVRLQRIHHRPQAMQALSMAAALGLAGACAAVATWRLPVLPRQLLGDSYNGIVTSGIGPALAAFTAAAAIAVYRSSRTRRSILEVWILAALVLLLLDSALTMSGGSRGSIGWYAGRVAALVSAFAVLVAYLREVESLQVASDLSAEQLQSAETKLRQSQKMEAVGQLTGGIAHDFNNLLMIMTSSFEMIARRPDDRVRVAKMTASGLQAADRGARLTRQLLSFARRQALHPETVNLNFQLLQFNLLATRAVGANVKLRLDFEAAVHPVVLDPTEFERAILNLVVNARDAIGEGGGNVVISTRNEILASEALEALGASGGRGGVDWPEGGGLVGGGYAVVAVRDDGPGMPPEVVSKAFDPFFTTKPFGKGSGLGLSQVYGFAAAAGGEAVIIGDDGKPGTTIELWLPRASSSQSERRSGGTAADAGPPRQDFRDETVLVVEDEPEVMSAVLESFADLGYKVVIAQDAAEALERLQERQVIDLLFTDIVMPGKMNGVELAQEALRLRPRLRVLLTSGYSNQVLVDDYALPQGFDILAKPYHHDELERRLAVALRAA